MGQRDHHLFVYGTLMSNANGALGKTQRDRLAREGRSLGPATLTGARLYDLGRYPGLTESGDAADIVHGELIALDDPHITLVWIDAYEGLAPGGHDENEYARVQRDVRLASGGELTAWVYVLLREIAQYRPITSGRWKGAR